MNKYKLIAIATIIINFGLLGALETDAISILTATLLIIPMEGLMIWAFNRSGWIDTEAVEADKQAIKAAVQTLWKRGKEHEKRISKSH